MLLALLVLALITVALAAPVVVRAVSSRARRSGPDRRRKRPARMIDYDPGRERRAEQRARQLLRSCVNDEEWGMYRDLGFIRVDGRRRAGRRGGSEHRTAGAAPADGAPASAAPTGDVSASATPTGDVSASATPARDVSASATPARQAFAGDPSAADASADAASLPPYAYLVYPHKPILAYVPQSGQLLSEYCVEFPDLTSHGASRLPASDDVLAKWMALTSDETRVIARANMHLVGRQLDPARVRRDLWRLSEWERRRTSEPLDAPSRRGDARA